jgi:hypothetical protein
MVVAALGLSQLYFAFLASLYTKHPLFINTLPPGILASVRSALEGESGLGHKLSDVGLNLSSPAQFFKVVQVAWKSGPLLSIGLVFNLTLMLYVVLRPLVPSFRLKRMLFNLYPDISGYMASTTARWHVPRSTGVYGIEAQVFDELGLPLLREVPFDLILGAGFAVLWMAALLLPFVQFRVGFGVDWKDLRILSPQNAFYGSLLSLRIAWLIRTWRRRQRAPELYLPFEVDIRDSQFIAEVQDPSAIRLGAVVLCIVATATYFFDKLPAYGGSPPPLYRLVVAVATGQLFLCLAAGAWWYRLNRELRDFGVAENTRGLGHLPVLSGLAMACGWVLVIPPFVSLYRGSRRIRYAAKMAGVEEIRRHTWSTLARLVVFPFALGDLQSRVNRIWIERGDVLPDRCRLTKFDGRPSLSKD